MDIRLRDVLDGREENYIYPFIWMHGEDEVTLRAEVEKIYQAGIRAFCWNGRCAAPNRAGAGFRQNDMGREPRNGGR